MSKTLWAPWRMEYLLSAEKPNGCIFCSATANGPKGLEESLVLSTRQHSFVIMNRYPYAHGHIMVVPRKHVSKLSILSSDERCCLFDLTADSQKALEQTLGCQGMNMGMNLGKCGGAGIADHIHVHLVPRWEGDTNFMPLIADVRVMPEHLHNTYKTLQAGFGALSK